MTQLLISIKDVNEAITALKADIDIMDLKDPANGALGALSLGTTAAILKQTQARTLDKPILISATVGENHLNVDHLIGDIQARADFGVDILKLPYSHLFNDRTFAEKIKSLTGKGLRLVCVFFADQPLDLDALALLNELGFYGAMLDTQSKSSPITEIKSTQYLADFVSACKQNNLICGLAGSLNQQNAANLLAECAPDFLGFRGGVCDNEQRNATLVGERLQRLHQLLLNHNNSANLSQKGLPIALHS